MKMVQWHIKDLIDLEYLLHRDEVEGEESLIATDLLRYLPHAFKKVRIG